MNIEKITALSQEVVKERKRQIVAKGYDLQHDSDYTDKELAKAAVCFAWPGPLSYVETTRISCDGIKVTSGEEPWPWEKEFDKRDSHSYRERLIISSALLLAELQRLDGESGE